MEGGDSSPTPTPPANAAPAFTSSTSTSVTENTSGTVYVVSASDPNGDPVTFSIAGGADAAAFSLSGANLAFNAAPNFEKYADANRDNVFEVTLEATDGRGGTASQSVRITLTNDREGTKLTRILAGVPNPVGMAATGQSATQLVVGSRDGTFVLVEGNRNASDPAPVSENFFAAPLTSSVMLDISFGPENAGPFRGLIGMFASQTAVTLERRTTGIYRFASIAFGDGREVGGQIGFAANGEGFAALGDPGGNIAQLDSPPKENGFGKFFRLEPGSGASLNAFDGNPIGRGVQNPGGFAMIGNQFAFADRGSTVAHELSLFQTDQRPINFGWPFLEANGTRVAGAPSQLIGPSLVYPVGDGLFRGTGIVMGTSYSGSIPGIANQFVFGDRDGSIWSIPLDVLTNGFLHFEADLELRNEDFTPDAGTLDGIVEIVADRNGTIYILDVDGELFRVDAQ